MICMLNGWLIIFKATKTKIFSFNHHRNPSLIIVNMIAIELPENTRFWLLGFIPTIAKVASPKFNTQETILHLHDSSI